MPIARLFFVLCVCVPCLFIDDAARSELVPIDMATNSKEVYCQILEEKKNVSVLSVMEESNVSAWSDVFLGQIQVVSGFQVLTSCYVKAENVVSFALFAIRVQQHTSRPKQDSSSVREHSLEKMMLRFPGETASLNKIGIEFSLETFRNNPLLFSSGSIDDHAFFDPFSLKTPIISKIFDFHNCRSGFGLHPQRILMFSS